MFGISSQLFLSRLVDVKIRDMPIFNQITKSLYDGEILKLREALDCQDIIALQRLIATFQILFLEVFV